LGLFKWIQSIFEAKINRYITAGNHSLGNYFTLITTIVSHYIILSIYSVFRKILLVS
jgi:hypothetical protein